MKRFIITIHSTADGKWRHIEHPEFGVYRSDTTASRKLNQLVKSGEVADSGIGMGTVDETSEKLPFTSKNDYQYPMSQSAFNNMIKQW